MADLKDLFQSADWKTEKHVPVIDCPGNVNKGESLKVEVSVGKEIAHPNTTEHHIRWIELYFLASNEKFPYQIGRLEFNAHGESAQGANISTIFSLPKAEIYFKTEKSGTLIACAYCNIHGLWKNVREIIVI